MNLNLSQLKDKFSFSLPIGVSRGRRKSSFKFGKRRAFYLIYGLVVFMIVFGGNYFSSRVEPLIRAELQKQQKYKIVVNDIRPNFFPPKVEMRGIDVRDRKNGQSLIKVNNFSAQLDLLSLVKGTVALKFDGGAYGTLFSGVAGSGLFSHFEDFFVDFESKDISLAGIPALAKSGYDLKGLGTLRAEIDGKVADLSSVTGVVHFDLEKPSFKGVSPLFVVPKVEMDSLKGRMRLNKLVLSLEDVHLAGKSLSGNLAGNIKVDPVNVANSKLDLKGQIKADVNLFNQKVILQKKAIALMKAKKPISVEISDTLGSPWVSVAN